MKIIYEPKGAAKEYSELAVNLYLGCNHGCKYCFAPRCMFKTKEEYFFVLSVILIKKMKILI